MHECKRLTLICFLNIPLYTPTHSLLKDINEFIKQHKRVKLSGVKGRITGANELTLESVG